VPKKLQESKLKKGEVIAQHSEPVCVLWWWDQKHVTMISMYRAAKIQIVVKRVKKKQVCVRVCVRCIITNAWVVLIGSISCCRCA
jgi:hypothetical protein